MSKKEIDLYISKLSYDIKFLLSVPGENIEIIPEEDDATSEKPTKDGVLICHRKKASIDTSFDVGYILSPINDIIWPGNLIYIDSTLADGTPSEIKIKRHNDINLFIDLPGLKDGGKFNVSDVSMVGVNSTLQFIVDEWINNSKANGYGIKSDISFVSTNFYNKEQALGSLGISYKDLSTSVNASLSIDSLTEKQVAIAMLKQTYYSVYFNIGSEPSSVFCDDITLNDVKRRINDQQPAGYVSQVDFGRIVFFKLETSSSELDVNIESLLKHGKERTELSVELKSKYEKALKDSKLTIVTVGGNASVNIEAIDVKNIDDFVKVIKDKESVSISKENFGVPISYTIKQLKNSSLAKRYLMSDYFLTECKLFKNGWIELRQSGAYVANFHVTWIEKGKPERVYWESGNVTAGYYHKVFIPASATDVRCDAWVFTGLAWKPKTLAYRDVFSGAPNCSLTIKGTTLNTFYEIK